MAALSAAASRLTRNSDGSRIGNLVVTTSDTIYQGSLLCMNLSTGRVQAATAAASLEFVGLALETVTGNTGGTKRCKFITNIEAQVAIITSALTTADMFQNVAIATDNEVTTGSAAGTAGVRVYCGYPTESASAGVWWIMLGASAAGGANAVT